MEARLKKKVGLWSRLASFKSIKLGELELQQDRQATLRRFRDAASGTIKDDRAGVIVLGCPGARGFHEQLQRDLGVPVIDPGIVAVKFAESMVELKNRFGWTHSKIGAYETAPKARETQMAA